MTWYKVTLRQEDGTREISPPIEGNGAAITWAKLNMCSWTIGVWITKIQEPKGVKRAS